MPAISRIRFTNVQYEEGHKRYNDEIFLFDGQNSAIVLENGGGKTVFIQAALQAVFPRSDLAERKIRQTLHLDRAPAHIAVEWILSDQPRRYLVTAVSLFLHNQSLDSYHYVYEYEGNDPHAIDYIPFVRENMDGSKRAASRDEIRDYYQERTQRAGYRAETFQTIKAYREHLEEAYHIIANEWDSIIKINSTEGGVEAFFEECKTTGQLFDRLLIPTVEASIAGHDKKTFADTFEKRREQFKRYKSLKAQIEENRQIESELTAYVSQFEKLHEKEQKYDIAKQEAKGLLRVIETEKAEKESEKEDYEVLIREWHTEQEKWNKANDSYKVLEMHLKHEEAVKKSNLLSEKTDRLETTLREDKRAYFSLKLSEHRHKIMIAKEKKVHLEKELERIDEETGTDELRDKLDETRSALHGYFAEKIEEMDRLITSLEIEKLPLTAEIDRLKTRMNEIITEKESDKEELGGYKAVIQSLDESMEKTRQLILSKPDQESVEENLEKWKQQAPELDQRIIYLKGENKQSERLIEQFDQEHHESQSKLTRTEKELSETEINLEQYGEQQKKVLHQLGSYKPKWSAVEELHLKEESIRSELHDALVRQRKQHEEALNKERLALRFVDDYGDQDRFFADPFIDKKVADWKNQFTLLNTGIQYIENLTEADVSRFPYWSISLVTTTQEKEFLMRKVQEQAAHLSQPLFIFSANEITQILKGEMNVQEGIVPGHWPANMTIASFREWQASRRQVADEETTRRKRVEDEIQQVQMLINLVQTFIKEYPYERKQELIETKQSLVNRKQALTSKLRTIEKAKADYQQTIKRRQEEINESTNKLHGLNSTIEKAMAYLQNKKERIRLKQELQNMEEKTTALETEQQRLKQSRAKIDQELENKKNEISGQKIVKMTLENDSIFKKVKSTTPSYTSTPREVLESQFNNFTLQLSGISKQRSEVEQKLMNEKEKISSEQEACEHVKREHANIDETVVFPLDGKARMTKLSSQFTTLEQSLEQLKKELAHATNETSKLDGQVEQAERAFRERFNGAELDSFSVPLTDVPDELTRKKKQLQERKHYLDQQVAEIKKHLDEILLAEQKLREYKEKHLFLNQSVETKSLSEDQKQQYQYKRETFVEKSTTVLDETFESLESAKREIAEAKKRFRAFCHDQVKDVQMREMAIRGVENKTKYDDVIQFKNNMSERIQRAIRYNEETIRDADKELEQFVSHIHQHLRNLTDQLRAIPKKTKVKVDDTWREIYHFTIPDWDETDGKEQIRNHIDWILSELEKAVFSGMNGADDQGKVRKEIEKWLDSKQLLRIVMNQNVMKVSCRKVTNDNRVATRRNSWEETNNWSGGEKWSKNMTLFLGLLKYISEKTHHVEQQKGRNRTVIVDNPFGKASSDHVLNPVFFIAEQLGFQILALTAHAEGKFLHDHFPVIYSCRLRSAKDASTKVMVTDRQLHKAYFQDHEPRSLERLSKAEQMELF